MPVDISMPQLSDTMSEGKILTWLKKEGDKVTRGEALAEVATDKADLEIESFHEGTLLKIYSPAGALVKVGSIIAVIGQPGEAVGEAPAQVAAPQPASPSSQTAPQPAPPAPAPPAPAQPAPAQPAVPVASATPPQAPSQPVAVVSASAAPVVATPAAAPSYAATTSGGEASDDRVKISPLAKNVAREHGIDYSNISGSGEGGRIVKRDVEAATTATPKGPNGAAYEARSYASPTPAAAKPAVGVTPSAATGGKSVTPLTRMRQTIASRMVESTTTIPHFYATTKVRVDPMMKLRATLKALPQYEGITFNHLILRATALALRSVPRINSCYDQDSLVEFQDINIGIVTAVTDGLLIPVVKCVDHLPLAEIVDEAKGLVQRARAGRPKADDLVGGTFSISNMGNYAVDNFTAIISPGQGGILAVSGIQQEPVVVDGVLEVGSTVKLTVSVDHRIIDGVLAGEFLTELKRLLEEPVLLLA